MISYAGDGQIDPLIVHDGNAYIGVVFDRPLGATSVTVTMNGEVVDDGLDLTQDGEFVRDGQLIEYFGFADESGEALEPKTWDVQCEWQTRADTTVRTACIIERR